MGKILLIRHGEVAWNKQACYTGWTDLPLTEKGLRQARRVAERLSSEPIEAVYCSDLQRAKVTAEIVAVPHRITPIIEQDLRELNYGEWEGVAETDLPTLYPDLYAAWAARPAEIAVPQGESFSQLRDRVSGVVARIMAERPDGTVAVVGHKSANRVLLCQLFGIDINLYRRIGQDNGAINSISFTPDRAQIAALNDTCHMSEDLMTS